MHIICLDEGGMKDEIDWEIKGEVKLISQPSNSSHNLEWAIVLGYEAIMVLLSFEALV